VNESVRLLVKLSWKGAFENLDAARARAAIFFLQPILQLTKKSSWSSL